MLLRAGTPYKIIILFHQDLSIKTLIYGAFLQQSTYSLLFIVVFFQAQGIE